MSAQATQAVIDSLEFARTGQSLNGDLPVRTLARLRDFLFDDQGEIRFEVEGGYDARQRPVLKLDVSGKLHLRCQRCLGALDYALRLSNVLLLGSGNEADPAVEDEGEWIEASTALDLAELVEDEILLGLPFAPRHGEGQCPQAAKTAAGGNKGAAFAKLAELKRNGSRN